MSAAIRDLDRNQNYNQHGKGIRMKDRMKLLAVVLSVMLAAACSKEEASSGTDAAMDQAGELVEEAAEATEDMMHDAGEMAEEAMDDAAEMAEDAMDDAAEVVEEAAEEVSGE